MHALRHPRWLLAFLTFAAFLLVTRGEFSDADTARRLQVTHWLWMDQPQVSADHAFISQDPTAYDIAASPGFCSLHGKDGKTYAQFGLGQSLLMLPADMLVTSLTGELDTEVSLGGGFAIDISLQETIVNLLTLLPLDVLAIIWSFDLLLLLGFSEKQALSASILLLFASPFIVYMQDVAETAQMYLCYIGSLVFVLKARRDRPHLNCAIAGALAGFNALMKLPNVAYVPALALVFLFSGSGEVSWPQRLRRAASRQALGPLLCLFVALSAFVFVDRYYQYYRFGEWTTTYMKQCAEVYAAVGGYPEGYPFGYDRLAGFLGPFLSPDRSLFLFAPFLIFTVFFLVFNWRRASLSQRLAVVGSVIALVGLALVYGGSYYWNGGCGSWGPRHELPAAEALCLLGFAFAAQRYASCGAVAKSLIMLNIVVALGCQTAAMAYPPMLENRASFLHDPLRLVPLIRARNLYFLLDGSLVSSTKTLNSPELQRDAETASFYSPFSLWLWIASANLERAPLVARAIVTAWLLLAAAVMTASAAVCSLCFKSPGEAGRGPGEACGSRGSRELSPSES